MLICHLIRDVCTLDILYKFCPWTFFSDQDVHTNSCTVIENVVNMKWMTNWHSFTQNLSLSGLNIYLRIKLSVHSIFVQNLWAIYVFEWHTSNNIVTIKIVPTCGAEAKTAIVAVMVNNVKTIRHSLSTTIACKK